MTSSSPSDSSARPPHHTDDGFRNPWPDSEPRGFRDVIRWSFARRRQPLPPDPEPGAFPIAHPTFSSRADVGQLAATWIGHATALLQLGTINVLTDPMWSARASPVTFAGPRRFVEPGVELSALPPIDAVLISHNHYDHLDRSTIETLARAQPDIDWLVPLGLARLLRDWGVARVRELDWWTETRIAAQHGEIVAASVPAQHFSARGLGDRGKTLWCSWVVAANSFRVFFGGDTAYHPDFPRIAEHYAPFDLLMLPVGAYEPRWFMRTVHMNPPEAMHAYVELSGGHAPSPIMLPIHWGTFRLTDESMREPAEWTDRLWKEAGYDPARLWLLRHGETRTLHRA